MSGDPNTWEIPAAVGQVVAACAAVAALLFVGLQISAARRTSDMQVLQDFTRGIRERERALFDGQTDDGRVFAFNELVNFLECNAAAYNNGLFSKVSGRIARSSLIDSIAAIRCAPQWCERLADAVRNTDTFDELLTFMNRERSAIDAAVLTLQAQGQNALAEAAE